MKAFRSGDKLPEELPTGAKEILALLPPRVLGYALHEKEWAQFNVKALGPVQWEGQKQAWKNLELDPLEKERIRLLVKNHILLREGKNKVRPEDLVGDLIGGKGQGLVLLFHGVPGVGKTMTAEALAEETKKPLLKVGAKELNYSNLSFTSTQLEKYFDLAKDWDAIMLIDEADVFLRDRINLDSLEAGLVSGNCTEMLRVLEYFQGVLIMTTNRIKVIDLAMQSRIHLAVLYSELEGSRAKKVWHNYRNQLKAGNSTETEINEIKRWIDERDDALEPDGLNGRQIRNIFTLAQILAQENDGKITLAHIKEMWRSTFMFGRQLRDFVSTEQDKFIVGKNDGKKVK
ncbi:P-loop containing nucleoside triphosphate hydrolase protein [Rhizodiscina lignyota]|uniref:P-loop containing nucleoside triphosphate hydrolase protein n=1 Tax=Rhizodiscina lignyota TaxID=1504668 RepID=A0A9P4M348_9PEZI|nr:P-loop containing nucleoside triphosphate hydrolase protein [Rhizodiscina lignyota]